MTSGLRARRLLSSVEPHAPTATAFTRFSEPVADEQPVARRGATDIDETSFRARMRGWIEALRQVPNSAIALFDPDGIEFAAALVGAWYAGKIVYLPGDTLPATCGALKALGVAFVGTFADSWYPIARPASGDAEGLLAPLDADAVQLVLFTSGSSGAPHALHKRLAQLLAEVETLESLFGARMEDCDILATVSHQHIYGLLFKILWPLTARRPFIAESAAFPEQIVAQLTERRTAIVAGPAHLKRLPAALDWQSARAGACVVFSSGGPLPIEAVTSVEAALGVAPIEIYGSSETGGIAWRQRLGAIEQPWTPLPGVAVREHEGLLGVRSRHLSDDQWLVVADRIVLAADDRFDLRGRADRIVKIEGKRVSLSGIEHALCASGLVTEARIVPLDTGRREELGAVLVPSGEGWAVMRHDGMNALRRRLKSHVAECTERIARPRRWRWVDTFPVNAVGKSTERELARLFAPGALAMPAAHLLEQSSDRVLLELYVSPQLVCFDGHFAGIPILPGVAQVDWAEAFGRDNFDIAGEFVRLEAVKFHRLYQPGPLLSVELHWRDERGMLLFRFSSSAGPHSSGRIFFAN